MKKHYNSRDIEAARGFLEGERNFSDSSSEMPSSSSAAAATSSRNISNPIQDLLKCFCDSCESLFKRSTVEYAFKAIGDELLKNPEAREVFKKFLKFRRGKSKIQLEAETIVECYELANDILNGDKDLEENRADLDDLLFNEYWEDKLTNAIDDGTTDDFFHDLMRECALRVERVPEFEPFKTELRRKLGK